MAAVEVQPRGRRRDGARRAREHGLITLAVRRVGRARDVRRQRRLAVRLEERHDVAVELDLGELARARARRAPARRPAARPRCPAAACGSRASARARDAARATARAAARRARPSACGPMTRAGSTRVSLKHEQIAGAQELRQLGEHADPRRRPSRRRARASGSHAAPRAALARSARAEARSGNRCAASGRDSSGPVAVIRRARRRRVRSDVWCPRSESNRHAV